MRIDSREQHYIEVKRRLDFAYGRLSSMDSQIVDVAGAMASWRASWRQTHDPELAVSRVLEQPWPERDDVEQVFQEWLAAYREAIAVWTTLSTESKLRLSEPTHG